MAAIVKAGDRLLSGVAALRERDRALVQSRLGGQDAVVDLTAVAGRRRGDSQGLELVFGEKEVGRVTSAVPGLALAYVRVEVPADAELRVGDAIARVRA